MVIALPAGVPGCAASCLVQRLPRVLPDSAPDDERPTHAAAVERLLEGGLPQLSTAAGSTLLPPMAVLADANFVYVISEYVGESLKKYIGQFSPEEVVPLLVDALRALARAHSQVGPVRCVCGRRRAVLDGWGSAGAPRQGWLLRVGAACPPSPPISPHFPPQKRPPPRPRALRCRRALCTGV